MLRLLPIVFIILAGWPPMATADRLNVGMTQEPVTLDPTLGGAATVDEIVYANIFEGLTRIGEHGRVHPGGGLFQVDPRNGRDADRLCQ